MSEDDGATATKGRFAGALGGLALAAVVLGPTCAHLELVPPFAGFRLFLFGLLLALIAGVSAVVALIRSPRSQRRGLWAAAAFGGLAILFLAVQIARGRSVPRINDITTAPADPPEYAALANVPANAGRDMAYPANFAAAQQSAYPDLAPIVLRAEPGVAYDRALSTVKRLGWRVVLSEPETGRIEATDRSGLFRFTDDVAVRVRQAPEGAIIDVRSKSRDGKGDFGVNAGRIRAFRAALGS